MAHVKYGHSIARDGEQNAIDIWLSSVKELPHLKRKVQADSRFRYADLCVQLKLIGAKPYCAWPDY